MSILDKLKGIKVPQRQTHFPVWNGPQSDSPQGGISSSLLSRYFCCKERFRILVIEGLKPVDGWNHRLGYGHLWHCCEEAFAAGSDWRPKLVECAKGFCQQYPLQQADIDKWFQVCAMQFPLYVAFWKRHPDTASRTPLLQEACFCVPYQLPSGRTVYLRGKFDAVDLIQPTIQGHKTAPHAGRGIWLFETKTKGDIRQDQITRQLTFDIQTQLYLVALDTGRHIPDCLPQLGERLINGREPILGFRYNVVRRPLSGGKGNIVQKKATKGSKCGKCKGTGKEVLKGFRESPNQISVCLKCKGAGRTGGKPGESKEAYYARLSKYVEANPAEWFMRWQVRVTPQDVERFRRECLNPALENLCDDYEWWSHAWESDKLREVAKVPTGMLWDGEVRRKWHPHHMPRHYREPFGVWDPLREGGSTDLDEYVATGNSAGLQRVDDLFPELKEVQ